MGGRESDSAAPRHPLWPKRLVSMRRILSADYEPPLWTLCAQFFSVQSENGRGRPGPRRPRVCHAQARALEHERGSVAEGDRRGRGRPFETPKTVFSENSVRVRTSTWWVNAGAEAGT